MTGKFQKVTFKFKGNVRKSYRSSVAVLLHNHRMLPKECFPGH